MKIKVRISKDFWDDDFIKELSRANTLLYLYLMSNPSITECGIYVILPMTIKRGVPIELADIDSGLELLEKSGKILYDKNTHEVMLLNWIKYNFPEHREEELNQELRYVNNKSFVKLLYNKCVERGYDVEKIFKDIDME